MELSSGNSTKDSHNGSSNTNRNKSKTKQTSANNSNNKPKDKNKSKTNSEVSRIAEELRRRSSDEEINVQIFCRGFDETLFQLGSCEFMYAVSNDEIDDKLIDQDRFKRQLFSKLLDEAEKELTEAEKQCLLKSLDHNHIDLVISRGRGKQGKIAKSAWNSLKIQRALWNDKAKFGFELNVSSVVNCISAEKNDECKIDLIMASDFLEKKEKNAKNLKKSKAIKKNRSNMLSKLAKESGGDLANIPEQKDEGINNALKLIDAANKKHAKSSQRSTYVPKSKAMIDFSKSQTDSSISAHAKLLRQRMIQTENQRKAHQQERKQQHHKKKAAEKALREYRLNKNRNKFPPSKETPETNSYLSKFAGTVFVY